MISDSEQFLAGIDLDPELSCPLYSQLVDQIRMSILDGRLRHGRRVPPTRRWAGELGVSRNTVVEAFEVLKAEGYLVSRVGSGTFVSAELPEALLRAAQPAAGPLEQSPVLRCVSERARTSLSDLSGRSTTLPFRNGLPSLADFPWHIWGRIHSQLLRTLPWPTHGYGDPMGYLPLREAVAEYLSLARAVSCEAEQVLIVNGSQQALHLAAHVLLDPGEVVWVEDPGYPGARDVFRLAGLEVLSAPVDREGIRIDPLWTVGGGAMAYVTPSNQFPLGITMSVGRRMALLEWASAADAWILEDDYDSEYRYEGRPLSSLQGIDASGRVIYMGTLSKVLFPGLRLGYLVVPPSLVGIFRRAKDVFDRGCSTIDQAVLARFITEGHFGRHLRRMRTLYGQRRAFFVEAAERLLGDRLRVEAPPSGMHAIGWLPPNTNDVEVAAAARQGGVNTQPASSYGVDALVPPGMVFGYTAFTEPEMERGLRRLAEVLP